MIMKRSDGQDAVVFSRLEEFEGAPRYEVVKRYISESILVGELAAGTVLPSENALAVDFGVSVGTIRKALSALTTEGMLMRRRKTGTVVTGWAPLHNLSHFFRYFRLHGKDGRLLNSQTILLDYHQALASEQEVEKLKLQSGDTVIYLKRLRKIDGVPAMHETIVLPEARLPDFPHEDQVPSLLYRFLMDQYDIRVAAVREQITAELASEEDCRLLALQSPQAILVIDEISFDQSALPVILAHHRFITRNVMYVNEIR
ncbi:GntR family transcriptional regulator [Pectobacteriaceae bacterium CE70]|uniref:GntR family transcriptional regulator n=1 Tax=Serratia sp. (strain ATCC 39006) TaxID=104623 RepID=A0A2I5THR8_SERS3|nr:GntR family transcriptional regulator [Serratia sp. ATCC 39006]WJV61683.1 GntR family transcriptional regulator [Pectobacteriaceae bacterium C52]WJV65958.1 GntR family transcriptional regulator [Pectobacteriaceae bacterium CE70]WJY09977.1 GntR family transcriptional regulator [Pectobacteriaceae bacterium C80]AUG99791.1 GntR family transcriptional regulator [Serratia sp. ATCC 39006]AUH04110.1 GntR family transcriptional regulator [Serratia sp. ATCC 39006]